MALDINELIEQAETPTVTTAPKPDKAKAKSVTATSKKVISLEGDLSRFEKVAKNLASQIKIRQSRGLKFDDLLTELTRAVNNYNKIEQDLVVAKSQTITGVPGAGRGTATTAKPAGAAAPTLTTAPTTPITPTAPTTQVPGAPVATTPTAPVKPTAPTVDSKVSSSSKTTTEANDKSNQINKIEDSVDLEKAGLNRAVLQYMKENYFEDYEAIKAQIDRSLLDKNLTAPEISRITSVFKNTNYYRKATVENNRTKIGSYFIANGLDSIANKDLIDKLTTDVFIKGVVTETQAQKQIRELAVEKLGLNITTDANKLRIKSSMLDGGNSFLTAASQYVATYASTLGISAAEFNAFENDGFLNAFRDSTSLDDFQIRVKADPRYINSVKGRQEIDSTKLALQNLHRNLGMGYSAKDIEDQAMSVVSGKTTLDQLEYGRRSIAAEAFPAFRDRILAGENIKQIASPYAYAQSRLLEIPESSIDISDPTSPIRKALIGDGKTPKPLWQFEQELFKDARWQYTSNARDTMDKITTDVLSRFGVMG